MGPVLNGLMKLQSIENRLRIEKAKLTRCRRNVIIQENLIRSLQNALEAKKEEMQLTWSMQMQLQVIKIVKEKDAQIESLLKDKDAII